MRSDTMEKRRGAHPAIALFVFGVACAMTFGEVSAQVATFTTQQYPLLGNTHIAADLNGDGRPDLAGAGANAVSVMLGNGDGTFRPKTDFPVGTQTQAVAAGDFNSDGKVDLVVTLNSSSVQPRTAYRHRHGHLQRTDFFPKHFRIRFTRYRGDGSQWRRQARSGGDAYHCLFHRAVPCRAQHHYSARQRERHISNAERD